MSRPASLLDAVVAQATMEARLTARRGENLLAMVGIPVVVLLFVGTVAQSGGPAGADRLATLLPATLALAIVASGLVNLGIATAYEREYGVLKRLGGAPLGRPGLIGAKVLVVSAIAVAQVAALVILAFLVLGWRPAGAVSVPAVVLATAFGVACFAGLGLLLAGALRPEATLVLANVLFLGGLLLGGVLVPVAGLPVPLASVAGLLPIGALAEAFRAALGGGGDFLASLAAVAAWAVGAVIATTRTFAWD